MLYALVAATLATYWLAAIGQWLCERWMHQGHFISKL
jgi:hypothetical protein